MADRPFKVLTRGEAAVRAELEALGIPDYGITTHLDGAQDVGPAGVGWIDRPGTDYPDALRYIGGDYQIEEGGPWIFDDEAEDQDDE